MFSSRRSPAFAGSRQCLHFYSTPAAGKSNLQLVAEIRKLTSAPIAKARQALTESNGDLQGALAWLEKDLAASGATKAEKVKGRTANEGLISTSILSGGVGSRTGPVKARNDSEQEHGRQAGRAGLFLCREDKHH
jgi:elongation factor Ts